MMKQVVRSSGRGLASILSYPINLQVLALATRFWRRVYWHALKRRFRRVGENSFIEYPAITLGEKYVDIGKNFYSYARLRLEAYDRHLDNTYSPKITIGDDVSLNYDCHIACVNRVAIGDGVLIGSRVYITDHFHGDISTDALAVPPRLRKVTSKGPVVIENNVWIGSGVAILSNVRIGRNSIIGVNAVVTKDIPENCVAAGVPARVLRHLDENPR